MAQETQESEVQNGFYLLLGAGDPPESREMEEGRPVPTRPRECRRAVPAAAKG